MSFITKVPYACCSTKFKEYYTSHKGSGIPYYEGVSFQKGYGLGGIFHHWFRAALPFLVKGGKGIRKDALISGMNVMIGMLFLGSYQNRCKKKEVKKMKKSGSKNYWSCTINDRKRKI
ncbi:hypothetical protein HNY73_002739 [Argiope bruennichi]|uniref:Uncharacterized protein n=1 Tax=Argiope bruennichi TaxID=94029 RepID=A0A8T0FZ08_ARGBR|nr:hypothetical protein HNY73_002739 [Argiope bruennichi]